MLTTKLETIFASQKWIMINIENITQLKKRTLGLTIVLTAAAMAFAQEKQQVSGKIVDAQKI